MIERYKCLAPLALGPKTLIPATFICTILK